MVKHCYDVTENERVDGRSRVLHVRQPYGFHGLSGRVSRVGSRWRGLEFLFVLFLKLKLNLLC